MLKQISLACLLILLVACGGTPNPDPQPNPTDKTAPTLASSTPLSGSSNMPINTKLAFRFSEAMDEGSLELASTPAITLGSPIWNANRTAVAFDNETIAPSKPYTLTLNAKDVAGNALAETIIRFTTSDTTDTTAPGTPIGLVATPADGQVTLTWQANSESDVAGYRVYVGTAENALEAKDFVTTTSVTVTKLTNGTTYVFALDAVDASNNHSGQSPTVSATPLTSVTDTASPTIASSDPANGTTGINPRNLSIKIVFSEPMDPASVSLTVTPPQPFPALSTLQPVAATNFDVVWSEQDTVATIKPTEPLLLENTLFTFSLMIAQDKAGNELAGHKEFSFTTGEEAPRLVSSIPENGASNVQVDPFEIKLSFSKPIDASTFTVVPTLEPVDISNHSQGWLLTWNTEETELTITTSIPLPGYFLEGTTYTLALSGKSKAGSELIDTSLSFKTVSDSSRPTIVKTFPIDDTVDLPLSPLDVFIYFDDLMDQAVTLGAISSSPELPCTWQHFFFTDSANDKDLGSAFACRSTSATFEVGTTYTISISANAIDTSGNKLSFGTCIAEPNDPPCVYTFSFTTLTPPPPTGNLQLEISGLPLGQKSVRVTGPNFDSGLLDDSTTFSNLLTGDYTIAASAFTIAPGKPACRLYTPTKELQFLIPVNPNQTTMATVTYQSTSCAVPVKRT